MENLNKKTTEQNQELNTQKNASATKNNLFSADGKEKVNIDHEFFVNSKNPFSNQCMNLTGEPYSSLFYEDLFHLDAFIVRHLKTGLVIKCTSLNA